MSSRLKPVRQDPLEKVGLPSKGDTTLLDFRAQEDYIDCILTARARLSGPNGGFEEAVNDGLSEAFSRVSVSDKSDLANSIPGKKTSHTQPPESSGTFKPPSIHAILFSLRKLREGIVASHRSDSFALRAFHFVINFSILHHAPESYHPSILSLLGNRSLLKLMNKEARREMAGYLVLDLACRQEDLTAAYQAASHYGLLFNNHRSNPVRNALRCIVKGDFWTYFAMKAHLDRYHRVLISYADERMTKLAVNCLSRAYLKVDREFVKGATGSGWEVLKLQQGLAWEEDGRVLVIKKAKVK